MYREEDREIVLGVTERKAKNKEYKLMLNVRQGTIHFDTINRSKDVNRRNWNNAEQDLAVDKFVREPVEEIYWFDYPL